MDLQPAVNGFIANFSSDIIEYTASSTNLHIKTQDQILHYISTYLFNNCGAIGQNQRDYITPHHQHSDTEL